MQAFFNELSIPSLNAPVEVAKLFSDLAESYKKGRTYGIREIKIKSTFLEHQFCPSYTFNSWMTSPDTDQDIRTLLVSVLTTSPFADDIFNDFERHHNGVVEFRYGNTPVSGLGLASNLAFDTVTFSFLSENWQATEYPLDLVSIEENEDGESVEIVTSGESKNIFSDKSAEKHKEFIEAKIKTTVQSARFLWLNKATLFPNLDFCIHVEEQLVKFENGPEFHHIINRLFELQDFLNSWDGTPIKPADFKTKVTPESDTRLAKFKSTLTYTCPDGQSRLFSWHSRFTPGAGRVHFFPLEQSRKFVIGNIANQNSVK